MKMKVCIVKSVAHNYETVVEVTDFLSIDYYLEDGRISMTEVVEIDLPEIPAAELVDKQVVVIDKQMTKVRADAEASITALEGRKQELLAISHSEE